MSTKFWIRRYPDTFAEAPVIIEGLMWEVPKGTYHFEHMIHWEDMPDRVSYSGKPIEFPSECTEVSKCVARKWLRTRNAKFTVENIPMRPIRFSDQEGDDE